MDNPIENSWTGWALNRFMPNIFGNEDGTTNFLTKISNFFSVLMNELMAPTTDWTKISNAFTGIFTDTPDQTTAPTTDTPVAEQPEVADQVVAPNETQTADVEPAPAPSTLDTLRPYTVPALMSVQTATTAAETAKGIATLSGEGLQFFGRRLPIVGGALTLAFTVWSAGSYAWAGEYERAGAELTTGTVEALVNTTGLGLLGGGDAAREALRYTFEQVGGEEFTPDKSGLRVLGEYVTGTGDFTEPATAPTTNETTVTPYTGPTPWVM